MRLCIFPLWPFWGGFLLFGVFCFLWDLAVVVVLLFNSIISIGSAVQTVKCKWEHLCGEDIFHMFCNFFFLAGSVHFLLSSCPLCPELSPTWRTTERQIKYWGRSAFKIRKQGKEVERLWSILFVLPIVFYSLSSVAVQCLFYKVSPSFQIRDIVLRERDSSYNTTIIFRPMECTCEIFV